MRRRCCEVQRGGRDDVRPPRAFRADFGAQMHGQITGAAHGRQAAEFRQLQSHGVEHAKLRRTYQGGQIIDTFVDLHRQSRGLADYDIASVLFGDECRLRFAEVFQREGGREFWFDLALFNVADQVRHHLGRDDGRAGERQVPQVEGPQIKRDHGTRDCPRTGVSPATFKDVDERRPVIAASAWFVTLHHREKTGHICVAQQRRRRQVSDGELIYHWARVFNASVVPLRQITTHKSRPLELVQQ